MPTPTISELLPRYGDLFKALARSDYVIKISVEPRGEDTPEQYFRQWDGLILVTVALSEINYSYTRIRKVIPLLLRGRYWVDHLGQAVLFSHIPEFEKFVADLSVQEYSSAAEAGLLGHHYGLTLQPWSDTEPERLEFSLHLSAVAAALNEEMMMMAFSGDGLTVHRG